MDDVIVSEIDLNIDPFLEDLPPPENNSKNFDTCPFLKSWNILIMHKDDNQFENLVPNDALIEVENPQIRNNG